MEEAVHHKIGTFRVAAAVQDLLEVVVAEAGADREHHRA